MRSRERLVTGSRVLRLAFLEMNTAVVVPLKRFDRAKARLRLDNELDVTRIVEGLARGVIHASHPRPVVVVSEDPELGDFVSSLGAELLLTSSTNLNEAVQAAYAALGSRYEGLIVAHGDLLEPKGLGTFEPECDLTFYGDHRADGTNVIVLPTGLDFHFSYGPQSLSRHVREAERLQLTYRVDISSSWRFDVDVPGDLPGT
jgi:2-phospho-L-lactate guanylyltransferase (CobY/MobA/RfbA family)